AKRVHVCTPNHPCADLSLCREGAKLYLLRKEGRNPSSVVATLYRSKQAILASYTPHRFAGKLLELQHAFCVMFLLFHFSRSFSIASANTYDISTTAFTPVT